MDKSNYSWKEQVLAGAIERAEIVKGLFIALGHGKITAEEFDEGMRFADSKIINKNKDEK